MGSNRRTFLASLGAAGVLTACGGGKMIGESPNGGGSASTADNLFRPHQSTFLPLEIVNKTGYPDSEIWFYTVGQKTPTQPAWYHITDAKTGALAQCVQSDIKGGFVDYSLNLATGTTNGNMMLPTMNGGCRMYFSVGKKLKIPAGSAPNFVPGSPSGWSPGQANYDTLFDWWEFVNIPADTTQGFNPNTTQVDMLGLPMKITAIGKDTPSQGVSGGFPTGARTKIFNALKANKDFAKLIVGGAKGDLRAIAPNVAIPIGFMSKRTSISTSIRSGNTSRQPERTNSKRVRRKGRSSEPSTRKDVSCSPASAQTSGSSNRRRSTCSLTKCSRCAAPGKPARRPRPRSTSHPPRFKVRWRRRSIGRRY